MSKIKKCTAEQEKISRRFFCRDVSCLLAGAGALALAPKIEAAESGKSPEDGKKITAVSAKVISQKGHCDQGHKVGDTVRFTEAGVEGKICIHALYSMMPAVFALLFDARFPWLSDGTAKTHACPDAYNPVVFEITQIRE